MDIMIEHYVCNVLSFDISLSDVGFSVLFFLIILESPCTHISWYRLFDLDCLIDWLPFVAIVLSWGLCKLGYTGRKTHNRTSPHKLTKLPCVHNGSVSLFWQVLRTQLFYLKRYLFACNTVIADELKQKFWPKEYLYEEVHTYSIQVSPIVIKYINIAQSKTAY